MVHVLLFTDYLYIQKASKKKALATKSSQAPSFTCAEIKLNLTAEKLGRAYEIKTNSVSKLDTE